MDLDKIEHKKNSVFDSLSFLMKLKDKISGARFHYKKRGKLLKATRVGK